MMLVHEIKPNVFAPYPSGEKVYRTSTVETVIVRREDGSETQSDRECEPYAVEVRPAEVVFGWPRDRQESAGLFEPEPFIIPDGKRTIGHPSFARIKGVVREVYEIEDIPPEPPEPSIDEKIAAMANHFGLTVDDLKSTLTASVEVKAKG